MNGNNSLKCIKAIGAQHISDMRCFDKSDYFLPSEFVNKFADEVQGQTTVEDTVDEETGPVTLERDL